MRYAGRIEQRIRRSPRGPLLSLAGAGAALLTSVAVLLGRRIGRRARAARERAGYLDWNMRES